WKVENSAVVEVQTQKGVNISIVGSISPFGTVFFFSKFPGSSLSEKRKAESKSESKPIQLKKGTTAYHIVKFMESVMYISDKHNKKGMFIVMDNCKIH
ncbi:uncharacterized protein B0P05DRAFT_447842, partial [Gilbertella persicaria]|uniref:uncharacterized protein n=1 Tax=Gilbertella persicaria TaxID=101096 RepID=UPI0022205E0C